MRLLERLFAGCSRVTVKKMHGGFSGSLVLRTDSYDADGHAEEPTVTKIDNGPALVREVHETDYIAELAGSDAIRVLRGPMYAPLTPTRCNRPRSPPARLLTARIRLLGRYVNQNGAPIEDYLCEESVTSEASGTPPGGTTPPGACTPPLCTSPPKASSYPPEGYVISADGNVLAAAAEFAVQVQPCASSGSGRGSGSGSATPPLGATPPGTARDERGESMRQHSMRQRRLSRFRSRPSHNTFGGVVLEMAGACWVLPEFNVNLGKVELVTTFKQHLLTQLWRLADHEGYCQNHLPDHRP